MTTALSLLAAALPDTGAMARLTLWASDADDWVRAHSADIAIASLAGLLLYLVLRTMRRYVRRAATRQADANGVGATILRVLARTGHFFLVMVSIRLVVGYANPPELIGNTVRILFIIAATFQAAIWVREAILGIVRARAVQSGHEMLGSALSLINVLVSIALFAIAIIVVLDNVGVNVTGLIAGLGIGGIAIGLAAKGVFEDLFAALAIIFDRPFRVGETIGFEGRSATVERIGMKSTRLRALTGEEIIVSNTALLNKELSNYARLERRRMTLIFGITYETPVAKLRSVPALARAIVETADHSLIRCGMTGFGDSSIDFELQFDVHSDDYAVVFDARHAIGMALVERFASEDITFAYPVQIAYTAAPDGSLVLPYAPAAPEP
jgi:small-conductance mechanosensitive channel